ncbi:hypothetical protein LLH06_14640 [Mucilaginibacter daejeonensis]|uniref:hypothetical protein n=1 Tax=Mucilaginibacter daejeonensis TaxID=398049 RepID=UPI001D177402|nr:hypothetical protein [Mucilaginibacter daejeonensis]UEG52202.1 hypothetical protein LLH06_14640 [Mucilaginibacter daejeonensis]
MKNIKYLTVLFLLVIGCTKAFAQAGVKLGMDMIQYKQISVKNAQGKTFNLSTAARLQQAFGKAKVVKQADEVLGGYSYKYRYDGLKAYFHDDHVQDLTITGKAYQLVLGKHSYRVGDDSKVLRTQFPVSYKAGLADAKVQRHLVMGIAVGKVVTDAFVTISCDANGRITEMSVSENNN